MVQNLTQEVSNEEDLSLRKKLIYLLSNITVEPVLLLYVLQATICNLSIQNLYLHKACISNLNYSENICNTVLLNNGSTSALDEINYETQTLFAHMNAWLAPIRSVIPAILILFFGSYSDRSGRRKPFLFLPVLGEFFATFTLIFCTFYMKEWKMEVAGVLQQIIPSVTGGALTIIMAAFSYIADVSTIESRTLRIGFANIITLAGAPLGTALSGALFQLIGFYGVFILTSFLNLSCLIYISFFLKEPKSPNKLPESLLAAVFDPKHIFDTFYTAFRRRNGNLRCRILLGALLSITLVGPTSGEGGVGYIFVRKHFGWNEADFGFYASYVSLVALTGTVLSVGILVKILNSDDHLLGALTSLSKIIGSLLYASISSSTIFYIASLIEIPGNSGLIAMRSILSKFVEPQELGKVNSLIGLTSDAIAPVIYQPVYLKFYALTVRNFPGAFFLLSALLSFPSLFIFGIMYWLNKKCPVESLQPQESSAVQNLNTETSITNISESGISLDKGTETTKL